MTGRWIDVTRPMREGMTVWPGSPPFRLIPEKRRADGASSNNSSVSLGLHTGTHVDAPWHFIDSGRTVEALDTSLFTGMARVIECTGVRGVGPDHLGSGPFPERVLIKTSGTPPAWDAPFDTEYSFLDTEAARLLVDSGVRLVGIDTLSIAPFRVPGETSHQVLLGNGVLVVEGLNLAEVPPGDHEFVILPMLVEGADGAPARALVRTGSPNEPQ
jgi:arylformamidase